MYVRVYVRTYLYACTCVRTYVYVCTYLCAYAYVCICICMCKCICICIYICVFIYPSPLQWSITATVMIHIFRELLSAVTKISLAVFPHIFPSPNVSNFNSNYHVAFPTYDLSGDFLPICRSQLFNKNRFCREMRHVNAHVEQLWYELWKLKYKKTLLSIRFASFHFTTQKNRNNREYR